MTAEVVGREGRVLTVRGRDLIDETSVADSKPVVVEFLARGGIPQPARARELMRGYWKSAQRVRVNHFQPC